MSIPIPIPEIQKTMPGESKPKVLVGSLFKMKFKFKGVISEKFFNFEGSQREATERAKQHCVAQGYSQHIWTEPMIHDLDAEDESVKSSRG